MKRQKVVRRIIIDESVIFFQNSKSRADRMKQVVCMTWNCEVLCRFHDQCNENEIFELNYYHYKLRLASRMQTL